MWCMSGWWRWGSAVMSARPGGRWPRSRRRGGSGIAVAIGRGCRSRGCGASSTGVRARLIGGRRTCLFCAWLAWSRFRVVIPTWDRTMGTLVACLDATLRRVGGAPTYLLSDNEKTVTVEHVAGIPVRHPTMVAVGRHYGCKVESCVPYDPETKGGVEATVKIAKRDLVPTIANLRDESRASPNWWQPPTPSARR